MEKHCDQRTRLKALPNIVLRPVPLPLVRPILLHMVRKMAHRHPEFFSRLGDMSEKKYLIDPVNLPFVLLFEPDRRKPQLQLFRRSRIPPHDARISGTLLTLLDMAAGRLDGDALFFSRRISVTGDIEAVVTLRNALDDMEGTIEDDLLRPFGRNTRKIYERVRSRLTNA